MFLLMLSNIIFNRKKFLITLVISIISILIAWCCWKNYQIRLMRKLSLQYENIINDIQNNQIKTLTNAEKFAENNKNIYGVLVLLEITKKYVEQNKLERATVKLRQARSTAYDSNLKAIIGLRLARIQIQQNRIDEAMETLNAIREVSFIPIISDLQGEALLRRGDQQGALNKWKTGMKNSIFSSLNKRIQMKIDNLS